MAPRCPSCGAACEVAARFCPSCGHPLDTAADDRTRLEGDDGTSEGEPARGVVAGAPTGSGVARVSPRAAPDSAAPSARFVPGSLLAGRYRVVGLLGKGGMGEVYRADDLTLGQAVALKFLPASVYADPDRLARFRDEVRIARQVSHPNVCRVYDIGEVDGLTFLSMEYIDGEDLGALLRRIGRFPQERGLEIARQICAGLAAAHDRGIVHRDLKPANVMIDGRGHARIADFGLADADDLRAAGRGVAAVAGTPAYMAPEQFGGRPASVQSDLYALGLVLYEIFTGKPAFSGATVGDLATSHRERTPSSMTALVGELDPAIERAIQRCLEKDPAMRPASALAVSASLPGGDPLAAAMARGETPSPDLVASAGSVGLLNPVVAVAILGAAIACLAAVVVFSGLLQPPLLAPMPKSPEILAYDARRIAGTFDYPSAPVGRSWGFATRLYLDELRTEPPAARREHLRLGRPSVIQFWYRESPGLLASTAFGHSSRVSAADPPDTRPGMIGVTLDPEGRLIRFVAVPSQADEGPAAPREPDWSVAFKAAGLDVAHFTLVAPRWTPPVFGDARAAWDGRYPERADVALHVEAAALHGRIVYFDAIDPWRTPVRAEADPAAGGGWFGDVVTPLVFLGLLGVALLLALRNLRLGRGDRRGAFRLAAFLFLLLLANGVGGADLHLAAGPVFLVVLLALAQALVVTFCAWFGYIALEPYVRRRWPQVLIAWARLLAGRWRDPLVGRDVLAGVMLGLALQVPSLLAQHLGTLQLDTVSVWPLDGVRFTAAWLCGQVTSLVLIGLGMLLAFFFLTLLVRRQWIAGALVVAFFAASAGLQSRDPLTVGIGAALGLAVIVFCLLRYGLLMVIVIMFVENLTGSIPLTVDPGRWFAPSSGLVIAVVVGLACFGAWTAANVRSLLPKVLGEG